MQDFPHHWLHHNLTVEVEAKAKEVAVLMLKSNLLSIAKKKPRRISKG